MQLYRSRSLPSRDYSETYCANVNGELYSGTMRINGNIVDDFNSPVVIGSNVYSCHYMFGSCTQYNCSTSIPASVKRCDGMFSDCSNFDNDVTISAFVENTSRMFQNCVNFNHGFTTLPLPYLKKATYMFENCHSFNREIYVSGVDSGGMLRYCTSFNAMLSIRDGVESIAGLLYNTPFNRDITIPSSVNYMPQMLGNCSSFSQNIYIKGTSARSININGMLKNTNNSKRKNVHFHYSLHSVFNDKSYGSMIGDRITWTDMTDGNGFYNTTYNIYCYNNYSG